LIENGDINVSLEDIAFIRTAEQMTEKDAKALREEFQYGVKTEANKELLVSLMSKTKGIVEKVEIVLDEL